jgi:hypothetical protein
MSIRGNGEVALEGPVVENVVSDPEEGLESLGPLQRLERRRGGLCRWP